MRAKEGVVDRLKALLTLELTATHQYLIQAELCRNWGYERLYQKLHEYSREELDDAEELAAHILYLEGTPDVQRLDTVQAGTSAHEQLQLGVALEQGAVTAYGEAIAHCDAVGDYTTRGMLEQAVRGEESQLDWLETQLTTIEQVGLEIYLAQQLSA
jgi:bacterioferritin